MNQIKKKSSDKQPQHTFVWTNRFEIPWSVKLNRINAPALKVNYIAAIIVLYLWQDVWKVRRMDEYRGEES